MFLPIRFANGRTTALVVDSGATHTTVVPVHDGYALRGATVRTPLAGDYVTVQCRSFMEQQGIEIVPPYMIQSKEAVKERMDPVWAKKDLPPLTQSYCSYMNNVSSVLPSLAPETSLGWPLKLQCFQPTLSLFLFGPENRYF